MNIHPDMQITATSMRELAAELGFAGHVTHIRVGKIEWSLAYADTVQTETTFDARCTMARIVSECLRHGIECSEPQALAAAYSVPDGTPIAMAVDNVGPLPDERVVEHFTSNRDRLNRAISKMVRS